MANDERDYARRRAQERQQSIWYKMKEGDNRFRILPTPVTKEYPYTFLEYSVHRDVGPKKRIVRCGINPDPSKGGDCWLCNVKIPSLKKKGMNARAEALAPRANFLVQIAKVDDDGKMTGPFLFTPSKTIADQLLGNIFGSRKRSYTDPKEGYNISINRIGTGKNDTRYGILEPDNDPTRVPKSILEKLKPFADLKEIPVYSVDRQQAAYHGRDLVDEEEVEEEEPKSRSKRVRDERTRANEVEDDDEVDSESESGDEDEDEEETPKPSKQQKKNKSAAEEDDEEVDDDGDDEFDEEDAEADNIAEEGDEELDDEEESPKPKKKSRAPASKDDEDEEDDDDEGDLPDTADDDEEDEEEEDEPPAKPVKKQKKPPVEDEDDEEEDAPAKSAVKATKKTKKPPVVEPDEEDIIDLDDIPDDEADLDEEDAVEEAAAPKRKTAAAVAAPPVKKKKKR